MEFNLNLVKDNKIVEEQKQKVFSFEEGVEEAANRIKDFFQKEGKIGKKIYYVTINGSSQNVGKSALVAALKNSLFPSGIRSEQIGSENISLEEPKVIFTQVEGFVYKKGIDFKKDLEKKDKSNGTSREPGEISDLYIGIYRPDREFKTDEKTEPLADILICNTGAVNDPFRYSQENPLNN